MAEDLFAHAWARLDRAGEVASRMVELWSSYIADDPYDIALTGDGNGVYVLRVYEQTPLPQAFAVATGEWINHLRSALDYTIWATAAYASGRVPPPAQGQIQYPVYDSKNAWDRGLSKLKSLGAHHQQMLLSVQPFNGDSDANFRGWVNRIARSDRHRHLSRMTGYIAELNPALALPEGVTATMQIGERVIADGRADVARFVVDGWWPDMDINVNPRLVIDPDIEEWAASPFWSQLPFPERLRMLQVFVSADIAAFEYDCTGQSRGSDSLTVDYRTQSDARRDPAARPPERERRPVQWSEPLTKSPASPSELAGVDFPPHGAGT